jgi:hypothetical protein
MSNKFGRRRKYNKFYCAFFSSINVKYLTDRKLFFLYFVSQIFNKLKVLNLNNSKYLTKSPDFSQAPQLEILILKGCTSLVQVHESIGYLKRLVFQNLQKCKKLRNLPSNIYNLESLKTLVLSECFNLKKLSDCLGNMMALTKLCVENTAIKQLPSSFSVTPPAR